jgi:hypothetical protein
MLTTARNLALLTLFLCAACSTFAQQTMKPFDLYKQYIQGDLDNREQVETERAAGKQIHPYAKHVNRLADAKITNKPANYQGFYILEESYYVYPEKPQDTVIKPYLFWLTEENNAVMLHSMQIPKSIPMKDLRNDNPALALDYNELKISPSFKPAAYSYNAASQSFFIKAVNEFPSGSFTLEETIAKDAFTVMELLIRDGKQLTPYSMPIIYKHMK